MRLSLDPSDPARDPDFRRLWLGETISLVGSQVTTLALPLTAIYVLDVGPGELGILGAAAYLPFLVFGLPAGAWVDRRTRRPILVAANLGRAVLIGLVPLAAALGFLDFGLLVLVTFLVGALSVAFDVGYLAYVPSLVGPDRLLAANARLTASASAAEIGGPGLAGLLVGVLSAPFALAIDAASYVVSAISLSTIRRQEPRACCDQQRSSSIWSELRDGLRTVLGHRVIRALAAEAATFNVFNQVFIGALLLYATRTLGLDAPTIGLMFSVGSVGALMGSFVAAPVARRLGLGRALLAAMWLACLVPLTVPFVGGPAPLVTASLAGIFFLEGIGIAITVVNVISLRQAVTPDRMLGRMHATYRTLTYGTIPVGALLGGAIGEAFGLHAALLVGAVGIATAPIWVVLSPVRAIRTIADVAVTPGGSPGDAPYDAGSSIPANASPARTAAAISTAPGVSP